MNVGGAAGVESDSSAPSVVSRWVFALSQRYQHILDKSTPHVLHRWVILAVIAFIYAVRVYFVEGFYIITYGLGIYILQLLIAFLSPQVDPEINELLTSDDGPSLPTRGSDEFRPFVRRLPEFKFCAFDVPVFWPILLFYWLVLFVSTMKRQIMHMVKYRYVPFTFGKQRYTGKKVVSSDEASISRS